MFGYEYLLKDEENRPRTCEDLSLKDFKEWEALYRWNCFMGKITDELVRREKQRKAFRKTVVTVVVVLGLAVLTTAATLGIVYLFLI